ncbi:ATP-binding protein [Maledivibacter halophilus]|uniref:MinD superfamily P-loop ATPase, contains an inserted ferredoxin domain n=1 Tax=Maledivibacter halophilus TaxID=36842 RepID=A0A1T5KHE6_9FIRM|nr:ATP-binding protein [Maledivibacter halophilus]SKC63137.1 MinD superfamily P-loop ATPase, contains an inserted ferredoxin domain [Maledivibacter halophilus]
MKISILSGKGGTGKTTVATNLAQILDYMYVDCDVEEPNGFIFLKPEITNSKDVEVLVPKIISDRCTLCGRCVKACEFNALANTGREIMVFEKLCHSCGACTLVCPENAIKEINRSIGKIDFGKTDKIECNRGMLNIGEPMAVSIIDQLKKTIYNKNAIIDCSPGSSCNVVKAIKDTDYAILVTEPTPFGLHDLKIAVELVKKMKIPFGVIVNRADEDSHIITSFCREYNITVLGQIPFDRRIAKLYSKGKLLIEDEEYREMFYGIVKRLKDVMKCS